MSGTTLTPQAVANNLVSLNVGGVGQQQLSASLVNSYRVAAVAERLASHVKSGYRGEAMEFFNLCLSLSRGIDYAVANNEVPAISNDLPVLLKQICQRRSDKVLEAAIMVLMISVKNACRSGWFSNKETEELFNLADEIGRSFCSLGDFKTGPRCCLSVVGTITERYYPRLKMGQILASLEVKPGYGAYVLDFHISKTTVYTPQEKIRLFVAQTDNIMTSACLTSPPQVNFLLNGKGVDRRVNTTMDTGPQMPTVVTGMLKFGSNLLQAVGQFNGPYIIVVAFMRTISKPDTPVLKDYDQPVLPTSDSDPDISEGPFRISLNCPISYTRIKTPVKGHLCKHLQCFDFSNYVSINLRRPSWRCPHCNQSVCYLNIRVDQNMAKVLGEVGESVAEVIISMDGSWKAVLENDDDPNQPHDKDLRNETSGQEESTRVLNALPNVVDLTDDDTEMDTVSACEIEDVKPFSNTNRVDQTLASQVEDDFWSGLNLPNGSLIPGIRSDMQMDGGIPHSGPANYLQSPVLTDAISPALDRGTESHINTDLVASAMHSQYPSPNPLLQQQMQFASSTVSNEYGRYQLHRALPRTPTAVQALPAQTQTPGLQQRPRPSLNSSTPPSASLTSQNWNRQDRSFIQSQSTAQPAVVGIPAPSQLHSASRASLMEFQNSHLQQAFNPRTPQTAGQSSSAVRTSPHLSRAPVQQGSAPVGTGQTLSSLSNQQRFMAAQRAVMLARQPPSTPVQNQTQRTVGGMPQAVQGADGSAEYEQNWRPTGRMRGSLSGRAYNAAFNQFIVQPTQPTPATRPPPNLTSPPPIAPSQLQAFVDNRIAQVSQKENSPPE